MPATNHQPRTRAPVAVACSWLAALGLAIGAATPGVGHTAPPTPKAVARVPATASASIIRPLNVSASAELRFGRLSYQGSGKEGSGKGGYVILPAKPPSSPVAVRVEISSEDDTSPLVREITGEPRRSYRISVPPSVTTTSGSLLVNSFTLWSRNSRDISSSRTGVLDSSGKDKLYLGGQVTVPKGTRSGNYWARVPVTISYE